jgi:hypothetical protein
MRWGAPHEEGDSKHMIFSFYNQIIPKRAPPPGQPITQLSVRTIDVSSGWLVSVDDWNTPFPTIAPYAEWKGDKNRASWVPDAYMAHVLQAYTAKSTAVAITSPACRNDGCVPRSAGPGTTIPVVVEVSGPAPAHVELWDGDKALFKISKPPYVFTVTRLAPAVHALIAHAVYADGKRALSKPSSVIVDRSGSACQRPAMPAPDAGM